MIFGIILVVAIAVCIYFVSQGKLPESVDSTTENRTKNIQLGMEYQTKTGGGEQS